MQYVQYKRIPRTLHKTFKFKYKKECLRKNITLYIKVKLTSDKILVRITLFQSLT